VPVQRQEDAVSVFMGVPTMYSQLLNLYDSMPPPEKQEAEAAAKRVGLLVNLQNSKVAGGSLSWL
jgi:malonyl-CoA/methylmalonyl-CoA synthetase